ncbi:MAG: hypothetical protein ACYCWW_06565 [Deltaproteobacteria bacterium]
MPAGAVGVAGAGVKAWLAGLGAAALTACAAGGASLTASSGADSSRGAEGELARRLYLAKCTLCHGVVDPAEHRRDEWPKLLSVYGARARLKAEDQARILAYLEAHAGR